jgi:hypothetical protein
MRRQSFDRWTRLTGAAIAGAAFLLYWRTAARDIVVGDTPEFVTAAFVLGVPHPPGYPLVTLLGHAFSHLPLQPLPFRVNLLSVVCSALAVGLTYFTAVRLTGDRPAAAAALLLAASPLFWEWSLAAEVFAPNNLAAAAMIFLLFAWHARPERARLLIGAAFVAGLGLANQLTIVLLGPAVLYVLWTRRAALFDRPWMLAQCAVALLVGLLPYAYIPWASARQPIVNWQDVSSMADLRDLLRRESYGTANLVSPGGFSGGSPLARVEALLTSFGWLSGFLVVAGWIEARRRARVYFWFASLAFLFAGPAFVAYANMNLDAPQALYVLERFFILPRVVVAPLTAFGVVLVGRALSRFHASLRPRAVPLTAVAVIAASTFAAWQHYAAIDQSRNHVARHFGEDILTTLPPGALLLAGGDHIVLPLVYLQAVERQRPDVTIVLLPLLSGDWYVQQLRRRHPDLVVPFDRYDGRSANMRALVDSNAGRPVALAGLPLDDSLKGRFWYYRYGLVSLIYPLDRDVKLSEMARDNERLWNRYRLPSPGAIKTKSFERGILVNYAVPALRVGDEHLKGERRAEARRWYERATAVAPDLPEVREALRRTD